MTLNNKTNISLDLSPDIKLLQNHFNLVYSKLKYLDQDKKFNAEFQLENINRNISSLKKKIVSKKEKK